MRVVFMGTPDFAVPALEKIARNHEIVAVITQKDKPKGRGHRIQSPPIKEKAIALGLPVYQPTHIHDPQFVTLLQQIRPDVIIVIAYGKILGKEILAIPQYGCINVHASLLPKYRGAAPIQWAVIHGERESGVTTMYMDEGLDTGDIIDQTIVPLEVEETAGSLFDKLAKEGGKLIIETLKKIENRTVTSIPQNDDEATYTVKITKELGKIDFNKPAVEIERLIRGFYPSPGAYTHIGGKKFKIWKASVLEGESHSSDVPGKILSIEKSGIRVATSDGVLNILELQPEGRKRMEVCAFLNGYELSGQIIEESSER